MQHVDRQKLHITFSIFIKIYGKYMVDTLKNDVPMQNWKHVTLL